VSPITTGFNLDLELKKEDNGNDEPEADGEDESKVNGDNEDSGEDIVVWGYDVERDQKLTKLNDKVKNQCSSL
jgi:hypothetical protein